MPGQVSKPEDKQDHYDELIKQIESMGLPRDLFVVPGSQLHHNLSQHVTKRTEDN